MASRDEITYRLKIIESNIDESNKLIKEINRDSISFITYYDHHDSICHKLNEIKEFIDKYYSKFGDLLKEIVIYKRSEDIIEQFRQIDENMNELVFDLYKSLENILEITNPEYSESKSTSYQRTAIDFPARSALPDVLKGILEAVGDASDAKLDDWQVDEYKKIVTKGAIDIIPNVIDDTLKRIHMDIEYLNYPEFQNNGTPGNYQKVLVDIDEINYVDEQNKDKEKI